MINQLLTQRLTLIKRTKDRTGSYVNSQEFDELGFFEENRSRKIDGNQQEYESAGIFYLRPTSEITKTLDWVINFDGLDYDVKGVDKIVDPRNNQTHHYEVHVAGGRNV